MKIISILFSIALLGLAGSCKVMREFKLGGDDPQWHEAEFDGMTRSNAIDAAALAMAMEEFRVARKGEVQGVVESHWFDGDIERRTNQQMRERAIAEVEELDEGLVLVRVRVQRQVSADPGLLRPVEEGDWEPHDDNIESARKLLKRIEILMQVGEEEELGGG